MLRGVNSDSTRLLAQRVGNQIPRRRTVIRQRRCRHQGGGDTCEWQHTVSGVINAFVSAGMMLTTYNEHSVGTYKAMNGTMQWDDGWFRLPEGAPEIPMLHSPTWARERDLGEPITAVKLSAAHESEIVV